MHDFRERPIPIIGLADISRDKQLACPVDRLEQYMNMVGHHAIGQQMLFSAMMVIQIIPDHARHIGSGQPINLARLVEVAIIVSERLLVDYEPVF